MNPGLPFLSTGLLITIGAGIALARYWRRNEDKTSVRHRLEALFYQDSQPEVDVMRAEREPEWFLSLEQKTGWLQSLRTMIDTSGIPK